MRPANERTVSAPRAAEAHRAIDAENADLSAIEDLAHLLDSRFRIPGTAIRFGPDAILGLIPGLGDAAAMAPALYLVWRARRLGIPKRLLLRMVGNVGVDAVVGSIPLAGSVFDLFFKANRRNHALVRAHVDKRRTATQTARPQPDAGTEKKVKKG